MGRLNLLRYWSSKVYLIIYFWVSRFIRKRLGLVAKTRKAGMRLVSFCFMFLCSLKE